MKDEWKSTLATGIAIMLVFLGMGGCAYLSNISKSDHTQESKQ